MKASENLPPPWNDDRPAFLASACLVSASIKRLLLVVPDGRVSSNYPRGVMPMGRVIHALVRREQGTSVNRARGPLAPPGGWMGRTVTLLLVPVDFYFW